MKTKYKETLQHIFHIPKPIKKQIKLAKAWIRCMRAQRKCYGSKIRTQRWRKRLKEMKQIRMQQLGY